MKIDGSAGITLSISVIMQNPAVSNTSLQLYLAKNPCTYPLMLTRGQ